MNVTAAVVREESQPFEIEELELEEPRAGEVLVRVVATGMCHTDIIVRDQWYPVPLPVVLGHDGAGIVEGDSVLDIFIPRLVDLYVQMRFAFDRLNQFYSLEGINQAAEDAEKGAVLKPVLRTEQT